MYIVTLNWLLCQVFVHCEYFLDVNSLREHLLYIYNVVTRYWCQLGLFESEIHSFQLSISETLLVSPDAGLYSNINQGCLTVDGIDDVEEMKITDVS